MYRILRLNGYQLPHEFPAPTTLHLSRPFTKTLQLTFVILLLLSGIIEVVARTDAFQSMLTAPTMDSRNSQLGLKLARLQAIVQREGRIDCIAIGSSTVNLDFDPAAFAAGYKGATGQPLNCFNFGIDAATAVSAAALAQILIEDYQPGLLIYGTDARDYVVPSNAPDAASVLESSWIQYRLGHLSLKGWLVEHSYFYRYIQQLYHLLHFSFNTVLTPLIEPTSDITDNGFIPKSIVSTYVEEPPDPQHGFVELSYYQRILSNYEMLQENTDGLQRIMGHNLRDTKVMVVQMPVATGYYYLFGRGQDDYQTFVDEVKILSKEQQVTFWQPNPQELLPDDGWSDYNHLNTKGAAVFSRWLGQQVGYSAP